VTLPLPIRSTCPLHALYPLLGPTLTPVLDPRLLHSPHFVPSPPSLHSPPCSSPLLSTLFSILPPFPSPLPQIQEQGEIREEDIKEEITRLGEKCRLLNEKVLSSGREIVLLKEGIESQRETHEGETRRLTEKLEITENSLQELGSKFRENEQLCKSLRSVLREKEDLIADSENVLTQRLQEQNLGASEFQRKSKQFAEDSAEMMARIKELEATAVKTR
jgi:hypothetical protein